MSTISESDKRVVELVRKSRERASAALPDEPSHARAVYAEGYVAGALGETIPGEYDSHPAIRRIWNGGFEAGARSGGLTGSTIARTVPRFSGGERKVLNPNVARTIL